MQVVVYGAEAIANLVGDSRQPGLLDDLITTSSSRSKGRGLGFVQRCQGTLIR